MHSYENLRTSMSAHFASPPAIGQPTSPRMGTRLQLLLLLPTRDLHRERAPAGPAGPDAKRCGAGDIMTHAGGSGRSNENTRDPQNPARSRNNMMWPSLSATPSPPCSFAPSLSLSKLPLSLCNSRPLLALFLSPRHASLGPSSLLSSLAPPLKLRVTVYRKRRGGGKKCK